MKRLNPWIGYWQIRFIVAMIAHLGSWLAVCNDLKKRLTLKNEMIRKNYAIFVCGLGSLEFGIAFYYGVYRGPFLD
jgi:hypothetical protein